jgi:hypothetical protein
VRAAAAAAAAAAKTRQCKTPLASVLSTTHTDIPSPTVARRVCLYALGAGVGTASSAEVCATKAYKARVLAARVRDALAAGGGDPAGRYWAACCDAAKVGWVVHVWGGCGCASVCVCV